MTNAEATLLAAIVGGVIGIIGTYLGAIRIANRRFLIDAGTKFREAFQGELATLEVPGDIDAFTILQSAFKRHLIAISEFNRRLPKCKRAGYIQAWKDYHCHPEAHIHFLEQYDTVTGSTEQREKNRVLAIKRIKHILSFTK